MKILWAFCVYNEIELLPFKIDYLRRNDIDPYVFDNMSTDGSWGWLQNNKIPSRQFDSGGMFDLTLNLLWLSRKMHEVRPDWVIMAGADIFYVDLRGPLRETIEMAERFKFNCICDHFKSFQFMFTGEEKPGRDPRLTYMYYIPKSLGTLCIAKYSSGLRFKSADYFTVPESRPYQYASFAALHYAMRHDAEKRKTEQYLRRKKAWDKGRVARCYGAHYKRIVDSKEFVFDKTKLRDVRDSVFWEAIKRSVEAGVI